MELKKKQTAICILIRHATLRDSTLAFPYCEALGEDYNQGNFNSF